MDADREGDEQRRTQRAVDGCATVILDTRTTSSVGDGIGRADHGEEAEAQLMILEKSGHAGESSATTRSLPACR